MTCYKNQLFGQKKNLPSGLKIDFVLQVVNPYNMCLLDQRPLPLQLLLPRGEPLARRPLEVNPDAARGRRRLRLELGAAAGTKRLGEFNHSCN